MSQQQATLIYNHNAGNIGGVSVEALQEALSTVGYHPVYRATSRESDLDAILKDVEGLVLAAGGDGTVRAVATRLVNKNAALSAIPLGTANNICRALGIEGKPLDIVARLNKPVHRHLDVGLVRAPWGDDFFIEAAGAGFYADILKEYDPEEGKSVGRALQSIIETLTDYEPHPCRLTLDGKDISGDLLWLEVLNTPATGPRLKLAPDADPSDGLFEVVCVHEDQRVGFLHYFQGLLTEKLTELPNVEVHRGRKLEWEWDGVPIHVDAEVRPTENQRSPQREPAVGARPHLQAQPRIADENLVIIEVIPRAVKLRLPRAQGLHILR